MYQPDTQHKLPTVSRFWNHLRFRNPLRYLPEPASSFLSYTTHRHQLAGSSYSQSTRPVSPPTNHVLSSGDMVRLESGRWSAHASTIHTQIEEGHGDEEHNPSDLETAPSLNPTPTNINSISHSMPPSAFRPSSSRPVVVEQPSVISGQATRWNEISPIAKEDSGQNDDFIVSFGNEATLSVPPVPDRSSDEDASPAEYGNQVASLYCNLAGWSCHELVCL